MPKVQKIFEHDGEVCVSLGKIEGEGNLVFLTVEEEQKKMRNHWNDAIESAAKYMETCLLMTYEGRKRYAEDIRKLKETS